MCEARTPGFPACTLVNRHKARCLLESQERSCVEHRVCQT